jgi:putative SOS response-associated peptidase YedK
MQWWLLPFWSKESRTKYSTFNARIENVATSHSFSVPFTRQRCLIPAKGWYEWQQLNLVKQPWYFHFASGEPAAFAGIWDFWERDGEIIESCAIIVGEPNRTVSAIHDRMPLFVTKENEADWLSPALTNPEMIRLLLQTAPDETVRFHKVSARVNNASVDSPDLVEALTE